jgi:DNA excision repair protein ERCC-1
MLLSDNMSNRPVVANPYAKKKAPGGAAAPAAATFRAPPLRQAHQQPPAPPFQQQPAVHHQAQPQQSPLKVTAATFSQVFGSVPAASPQQSRGGAAASAAAAAAVPPTASPDRRERQAAVLQQQPHVLYVSTRQRGNGVLEYVRNVPYQFLEDMIPDYVASATACALFLSIRYHMLHPEYIYRRIAELKSDFQLRILLVLVDVSDSAEKLNDLSVMCVKNNMTLVLSWSEEEAARYLETYKACEGKDATIIQKKKSSTHFADQVADYLTACKGINSTDAASLIDQFQSIRALQAASTDEWSLVSGLGQVKVRRLHDALHKPFSKQAAVKRKKKKQEEEARIALEQQAQQDPDQEEDVDVEDNDSQLKDPPKEGQSMDESKKEDAKSRSNDISPNKDIKASNDETSRAKRKLLRIPKGRTVSYFLS